MAEVDLGRVVWITNLKAIGILMVVLGHMDSPLGSFIYSWHMPLFFFVSGFFLNVELTYKKFLQSSFKRLMAPYFIFALVGLGIEVLKRNALQRPPLNLTEELVGIFWHMNYEGLSHQYGFVLWFLPTLFIARFIIFAVFKMVKGSSFLVLLTSLLLLPVGLSVKLPFGIDVGFTAVFWVGVGFIYYRQWRDLRIWTWALVVSILMLILLSMPGLNMGVKSYEGIAHNLAWAMSCIVIAICITKHAVKFRFLPSWGEQTMFIFIIHPYVDNAALLIVNRVGLPMWQLCFLIAFAMLSALIIIRTRFQHAVIFKYS